jgi:hypothetical protein
MKSRWFEHRGKRIFLTDYSNFGADTSALGAEIEAAEEATFAQPENSMLVIVDIRDTIASKGAMQLFKVSAARTKPHVRKAAIVGITGYKKVLIEVVSIFSGRSFVPFTSLEEAMDWIVEGD